MKTFKKLLVLLATSFLLTGCDVSNNKSEAKESTSESESGSSGSESSGLDSSGTGSTDTGSSSSGTSGTSGSSSDTGSSSSGSGGDSGDYYASISESKTGSALKTDLFNLIKITKAGWTYDGLWTAYRTSDVRPDGKYYWDIYSDSSKYTLDDKRINASYKKKAILLIANT